MRYGQLLPLFVFCTAPLFAALAPAPEPTPEEKAAAALAKGISNRDKTARIAAVEAFAASKPATPNAFQLLNRVVTGDSEPDVALSAYRALAKVPAHDPSVARMLVAAFNGLKPNDLKLRVSYAQGMEPSEFKSDTAGALADQLSKMRWAEDPRSYKGMKPSDKQREEAKQKRDEMKEMLDAFNAIASSSVTTADKDTPTKVKKWWDANEQKFAKADAELAQKYSKADADAAKAAKDAKEAAKADKK